MTSGNGNDATLLRFLNKTFVGLCLTGVAALAPGFATAQTKTLPEAARALTKMPPMFVEDASPANLARTVETFKAEAKAAGWSLLAEHDMAGILSAQGYTLNPVLILEVCSGKYSARLLARDETRHVASMIPCRVAIYQTSAGKVVISRMNSGMFASMMESAVGDVITKSGDEMEGIVARTLAKLK